MKRLLCCLLVLCMANLLLLESAGANIKVAEKNISIKVPSQNDFEENYEYIYSLGECYGVGHLPGGLQYIPLRAVIRDSFVLSRRGFLLSVYDLIADGKIRLSPEPQNENKLDVMNYIPGGEEEIEARLKKMENMGIVTENEINGGDITKEFVANVLYRIYKPVIPYKGSVLFKDTNDIAILWAAEVGLPYFLDRPGSNIYPSATLNYYNEYRAIINYAFLYLPVEKVDNKMLYRPLDPNTLVNTQYSSDQLASMLISAPYESQGTEQYKQTIQEAKKNCQR